MNAKELVLLTSALIATAKTAGKALDDFALRIYVKRLDPYPLARVIPLLEDAVERAKLPTVRELLDALDGRIEAADEAQDTADRIIRAIKDHGSYQSAAAMKAIGPVGAEVVARFGGWAQVCDVTTDGLSILRAQLRDSARSVMARARAGRLDEPAQLPGPSQGVQGLKPASNILQLVTGGVQRPARDVGVEDEAPF